MARTPGVYISRGILLMNSNSRIDTHQHIVPPAYAAWLDRRGVNAGGLPIPQWSVESAIALMDDNAIATGIVSVSTPGVHLVFQQHFVIIADSIRFHAD